MTRKQRLEDKIQLLEKEIKTYREELDNLPAYLPAGLKDKPFSRYTLGEIDLLDSLYPEAYSYFQGVPADYPNFLFQWDIEPHKEGTLTEYMEETHANVNFENE